MAVRMGDIRRGVSLAKNSTSKQLKKECAVLLDNMKQYNEAGTLFEASQSWDKAAAVYIKTKNWAKVGELMQHITSPKLLIQYAKAKEADLRWLLPPETLNTLYLQHIIFSGDTGAM